MSVFYIFCIQVLCWIGLFDTFSYSVAYLFMFVIVGFQVQKILILVKSILLIFFFFFYLMACTFCVLFKKIFTVAWIQSLVWELRSHIKPLHAIAKKQKTKNQPTNQPNKQTKKTPENFVKPEITRFFFCMSF